MIMSTVAIPKKTEIEFGPFEDPITHETMLKPVVLPCGHAFGEESITIWIKKNDNRTCPTCKSPALLKDIKPDFTLRKAVEELPDFVKKQIAMAVDAQTQRFKNTFQRAMEKKEKEIEDIQTPTGSENPVDWRRIYNHLKNIEDENSKNSNHVCYVYSYFPASFARENRHLVLHKELSNGISEYSGRVNDEGYSTITGEIIVKYRKILIDLYLPEELAQKDGFGQTPLHLAVINNAYASLKNIIEKMLPQDLAIQDITGSTALHYFADNLRNFCRININELIDAMRPEDLAITDEDGKTFMHRALTDENGKTFKQGSFYHYFKKMTLFAPTLERVTPEMLKTIDSKGYTPLHYAIKSGNGYGDKDQIIEAICKKMRPEDLNNTYANNENFLHFIVKNSNPQNIITLVKFMDERAKNEKDGDGKTPLELLDAHCQNNRSYNQARPHLIYREPIDQISDRVTFSMGDKVRNNINAGLGVGTIVSIEFDIQSQKVKYKVNYPDANGLELYATPTDLEKT